jgi:hypothetical protein
MVYGAARVGFADTKLGIEATQDVVVMTPVTDGPVPVDWAGATAVDVGPSDLESSPDSPGAVFTALPPAAAAPKNYATWSKDFAKWLYQSQSLDLLHAPDAEAVSKPGESERDFRVRLQTAAREQRDAATEAIRQRYATRAAALRDRIGRAEGAVARESGQATAQRLQTVISVGATILGAFMGRKAISTSSIGRATTAARGVGRTMKEAEDVKRAGETVQELQAKLADLEQQVQAETQAVAAKYDTGAFQLQTVSLKPKKTQITVQLVTLAWKPDA